jgi:hypothetical protein
MLHDVERYLLLIAVVAIDGYGILTFRGSNLRSPLYVSRPQSRAWSPWRFFADDEWTPEGLKYRRRFVRWWAIAVAFMVALALFW